VAVTSSPTGCPRGRPVGSGRPSLPLGVKIQPAVPVLDREPVSAGGSPGRHAGVAGLGVQVEQFPGHLADQTVRVVSALVSSTIGRKLAMRAHALGCSHLGAWVRTHAPRRKYGGFCQAHSFPRGWPERNSC